MILNSDAYRSLNIGCFEKWVPRRAFGCKRERERERGDNSLTRSL
jgi:hypothetical protein